MLKKKLQQDARDHQHGDDLRQRKEAEAGGHETESHERAVRNAVLWMHRGQKAVRRLQNRYANLTLVHGPVHASWLNQIEIYFSILQQKVLTPNDFPSRAAVAERLAQFERHYEQIAQPFQWRFTRRNLNDWLEKLAQQDRQPSALAA